MQKKLFLVELSSRWTLAHSENGSPANELVEKLKAVLPSGTQFKVEAFSEITISVDVDEMSEEMVVNIILTQFCALYGEESKEAINVMVRGEKATESAEEKISGRNEELTPPSTRKEDLTSPTGDLLGVEKKEEGTEKFAVGEEIDGLIAGEDFKDLAHELHNVAPYIIANKNHDLFTYQSYIFSINEGCGLSTYLHLFAKLIQETKLKNISNFRSVVELKLSAPNADRDPNAAFAGVYELIKDGKARDCVLCIDISEWLRSLESEAFRNFLMILNKAMEHYVVVFRIPYVETDVLERVKQALNDLIFVRPLSFPPFSRMELQKYAQQEIENYGFKMSNYAWAFFHERIAEEKRDGKFYGINTVKKIVRELLYKKQLSNAKKGKAETLITKRDAAALTSVVQEEGVSGLEQLSKLVGGEAILKQVEEILAQIEFARSDASGAIKSPCIHMRFVGNPGTGKTTVARIIGKILKEKGVLRIGGFYEYAGRDFCGRYVGETAPKTAGICRDAYGSILFIDEAYSLYRENASGSDYGREALDTLIAEMENHRDDFVVIMAGYTDEMDTLMKGNAGLVGRMPYVLEFPNFTKEQLYSIFLSMLDKCKYNEDLLETAKEYFLGLADELVQSKAFSNARFVRNLYERTWAKALRRCQLEKKKDVVLCKEDFLQASAEKGFKSINEKKTARLGFYE